MSNLSTKSESQDLPTTVPLSDGETALVVKRLHDLGLTIEAISIKTGMRIEKVTHLLALCSLPAEIFELYKRGEVAGSIALRMVSVLGGDKANELLTELLEKHGEATLSEHGMRLLEEMTSRIGLPWRGEGFYRVLFEGQWTVAKYFPIQDSWTVLGDDRNFDDDDFDQIDDSRIDMPGIK